MRMLKALLQIVILSSFALAAVAGPSLPPVLADDKDKAAFLGAIAEEIPWLLMEGAEYDVNFFDVLDQQNLTVTTLQAEAKYLKHLKKRADLITLDVDVLMDRSAKLRQPNAEFAALVREIQKRKIPGGYAERIAGLLLELSTSNPRSIVTGLIACLPNNLKGDYFKMSLEEQIAGLNTVLTDEIVQAKFRGDSIGVAQGDLRLGDLLDRVRNGRKLEAELLATIVAQGADLADKQTASTLTDVMTDQNWIDSYDWQGVKPDMIKKFVGSVIKTYSDSVDVQDKRIVSHFTVREVPFHLGLFRGIVGADCSTSFSGCMSFAADERTFFIYDEHGVLRGYAQGSQVTVNGAPHFYLHDVTGSRLSVQLMKDVIYAIAQSAEAFDATGIVFPNAAKIHTNNNYLPLRTWQMELVQNAPAVPLKFADAYSRTLIANSGAVPNSAYDLAEYNAAGTQPELPKQDRIYKVSTTHSNGDFKSYELTPKQAVILYLGLSYGHSSADAKAALKAAIAIADGGQKSDFSKRIEVAKRVAAAFSFHQTKLNAIVKAIANADDLPLEQFYNGIREAFESMKIEMTEADIKNIEFLFYEGHVSAPDSMTGSPESVRKTVSYALWLLKRWPTSQSVMKALRSNPDAFRDSGPFNTYVQNLVSEQSSQLKQLQWLLESGKVDPLAIEERGHLLESLSTNPDAEVAQAAHAVLGILKKAEAKAGAKCAS
jgi:hypothetical protein